MLYSLQFIEYKVCLSVFSDLLADIIIKRKVIVQVTVTQGFHVHVNDPRIRHAILRQIVMKQIQQGRFSAAANTCNDFHQIYIFVLNQLIQILGAVDQFSHNAPPDFLDSIIPEKSKKSIVSNL